MAYYYYRNYPRRKTQREIVSERYGGVDADVRRIFLNLRRGQRKELFDHYERHYTRSKRQYAEKTFTKWQTGQVKMSGKISERLLDFLPNYLSFEQKYELVQKLWHNLQPKDKIRIRVSPDRGLSEAILSVTQTVEEKRNTTIPDSVRARLKWLSSDDAKVAEELMKQVFEREHSVMREAVKQQLATLLSQIQSNADLKIRGSRTLEIAGTTIVLEVKRDSLLRKFLGF